MPERETEAGAGLRVILTWETRKGNEVELWEEGGNECFVCCGVSQPLGIAGECLAYHFFLPVLVLQALQSLLAVLILDSSMVACHH